MSYVQDRLYDFVIAHDQPYDLFVVAARGYTTDLTRWMQDAGWGLGVGAPLSLYVPVNHKSTVMRSILTHICPTYMHIVHVDYQTTTRTQ